MVFSNSECLGIQNLSVLRTVILKNNGLGDEYVEEICMLRC